MSRDFIGDPWNLQGGYTFRTWRFRCDPCDESREVTGDYPDANPLCECGQTMMEVPLR